MSEPEPTPRRGKMTPKVEALGKRLFGDGFDTTMLRLLPYTNHLLLNDMKLDPRKINDEERKIWSQWKQEGKVAGGASSPVCVSRDFYDAMNEVLWVAYADWHNQEYDQ